MYFVRIYLISAHCCVSHRNQSFCPAKQMPGFYIERNAGLKWINAFWNLVVPSSGKASNFSKFWHMAIFKKLKCNSRLMFYETYDAELISSFLFYFFFLFVAMGNDHFQTIAVKSNCLGVKPSTFHFLNKLACLFHIPLFNWVKFVLKDLVLFRKGLLCAGLIELSFFWLI